MSKVMDDKELDITLLEGTLALSENCQDDYKEMLSDWRWILTHPFAGFMVLRQFLQNKRSISLIKRKLDKADVQDGRDAKVFAANAVALLQETRAELKQVKEDRDRSIALCLRLQKTVAEFKQEIIKADMEAQKLRAERDAMREKLEGR